MDLKSTSLKVLLFINKTHDQIVDFMSNQFSRCWLLCTQHFHWQELKTSILISFLTPFHVITIKFKNCLFLSILSRNNSNFQSYLEFSLLLGCGKKNTKKEKHRVNYASTKVASFFPSSKMQGGNRKSNQKARKNSQTQEQSCTVTSLLIMSANASM